MSLKYSPNRNPRVIVIQKLYSKIYNQDSEITFPKHRFKKFIKDVVTGTLERDDLINEEIVNHLDEDLKLKKFDKVFKIIIKSAIYELMYKPNTAKQIIIKE